jgi:hypothetical protein
MSAWDENDNANRIAIIVVFIGGSFVFLIIEHYSRNRGGRSKNYMGPLISSRYLYSEATTKLYRGIYESAKI